MRIILTLLIYLNAGTAVSQTVAGMKLSSTTGDAVDLVETARKGPTLITFWALWCSPCKQELRAIEGLYERYRERGFSVVAINQDTPRSVAKVRSYIGSQQFTFPVVLDPNGQLLQRFNGQVIPYSVMLDTTGAVVHTSVGYLPGMRQRSKNGWSHFFGSSNGRPINHHASAHRDSCRGRRRPDVTPSVLNVFRYGTGKSGSGDLKDDFSYLEELMDLRVSFPRSLIVGVRLLYDIPPEVGPEFRGIKRRFAEFSWEGLSIRAGNSAQLFGQGLALNLFEDRGLAYDTWLDGVKLGYSGSIVRAAAVAGRVEYWDSVVVARTETYDLRGANLEIDPTSWMTLGGSYVETDGVLPGLQAPVFLGAKIHEAYASVQIGSIDAMAAWSHKRTTLPADTSRPFWFRPLCGAQLDGKGCGYRA